MRIKDFLRENRDIAPLDAIAMVAYVLGTGKEQIFRMPEHLLDEEATLRLKGLAEERRQGRPLAYITGIREFYSEPFSVDERVLIPRPETELVVDEALRILEKKTGISYIMDMGTGSGAIGITLARRLKTRVFGVDISPPALSVALENSRRLHVEERISFFCSDLFSAVRGDVIFDLVVANLPYVPTEEWEQLMVDVKEYEPKLALDGGVDGLEVYRRFIPTVRRHLKDGGRVLCEIDGAVQAARVKQMLQSEGFAASVEKDLTGRERMVEGLWTNL